MDRPLFVLVPLNEQALQVVLANPEYTKEYSGYGPTLTFSIARPSKTDGYLATFGRHPSNDIRLPLIKEERFLSFHMHFFLARSGELVIRDHSNKRTEIGIKNETADTQNLYRLDGNPRQRVIPKALDLIIDVVFGIETAFRFVWNAESLDVLDFKSHANLISPPGKNLTPTVQDLQLQGPSQPRYELRSSYTPAVEATSPDKDIRTYFITRDAQGCHLSSAPNSPRRTTPFKS